MNRAERRAAARARGRIARTFGLVIDWHLAASDARQAARRLIEALPGGAAVLATGLRFTIAAGEEGSAGAFLLGVAEAEALPDALRLAHARLGEFHPDGGSTPWRLFVDESTQRALIEQCRELVAH